MNKKGIRFFFLILVFSLLCSASVCATVGAASKAASSKKKEGLYKENGKYYYYHKGKKIKNKWKDIKKSGKTSRYYFQANGSACTSVAKIDGAYYCFSSLGRLYRPGTNKLITIGKYRYCPDRYGRCQTGWILVNKKLYYANGKGRIQKNKTVDGIKLKKSGEASTSSIAAKMKIKSLKVIADITKPDMTKEQKLEACWNYIVSRQFGYASMSPNLDEKDWQKKFAYLMLTTRKGSCSSFACAFAALASAVGYDPVIIYGRVPGSRDQEKDGYTRHCWVKIDGKFYDPEAQFAGWMRGVYGYSQYPISHQVTKILNFETGK